MQGFYGYSVINGCNHDVNFLNKDGVIQGRDKKYYIEDAKFQIHLKIKQEKPFNLSSFARSFSVNGVELAFPELFSFDPVGKVADIIIVSSKYADGCMKNFHQEWADFYDRLFTPISVYDKATRKPVGCIGLKKVVMPFYPEYYIQNYNSVSKMSALYSVYNVQACKIYQSYDSAKRLNDMLRCGGLPTYDMVESV